MLRLLFIFLAIWSISCSEVKTKGEEIKEDSLKQPVRNVIPEIRDAVSKQPIAVYREHTENPLNDWYFSVQLFETKKTFHYLLKLQYEEIRGVDTLRLPNFGVYPKPEIRKGSGKYSCIIGFRDKNDQFREYKKVYVMNNTLKITALRHYAVSSSEREIDEK